MRNPLGAAHSGTPVLLWPSIRCTWCQSDSDQIKIPRFLDNRPSSAHGSKAVDYLLIVALSSHSPTCAIVFQRWQEVEGRNDLRSIVRRHSGIRCKSSVALIRLSNSASAPPVVLKYVQPGVAHLRRASTNLASISTLFGARRVAMSTDITIQRRPC
ncbi:uncharacterized protein C8Q71DRAFT_352306 [Rhodofomes roseus]|uniref:Uncharacterized protein n=1 Tax=Rhodofomes roseus TaxID=34475 RepID=A0ABQ8KSY4_9APHY|nr:uncharacterized protein C8Q71DRAFT_352306 [Rhodofomes roseus]KAH9841884.1 hypothetical protein C8Q71DRAFT_352306 [Rhodofomes roseus]